jgi:hypothetical protein
MNARPTVALTLTLSALLALGLLFLFLPNGWNLVPLALVACLLVTLPARVQAVRHAEERGAADGSPPADAGPSCPGPESDGAAERSRPDLARRANYAFGPVLAGLVIDLIDFATFGPIGLLLGFPIGGLAGYWMGRALGLERHIALWCGAAAGVYCTIPGTRFLPVATIVGACVRFRDGGRRPQPASPERAAAATDAADPPPSP